MFIFLYALLTFEYLTGCELNLLIVLYLDSMRTPSDNLKGHFRRHDTTKMMIGHLYSSF